MSSPLETLPHDLLAVIQPWLPVQEVIDGSSLPTAHLAYVAAPNQDTLNVLREAVRRFALTITRRCTNLDAEDLAQQVLIAAWQGFLAIPENPTSIPGCVR
jgi:hypothetical protein